jgi:hypothetical protein
MAYTSLLWDLGGRVLTAPSHSFAHQIATNVDVTRVFAKHGFFVFRHGNAREIVLIHIGRAVLRLIEIAEHLTKV